VEDHNSTSAHALCVCIQMSRNGVRWLTDAFRLLNSSLMNPYQENSDNNTDWSH